MKRSAFDNFLDYEPIKPSTNPLLNQNNKSQEESQSSMCSTSINASKIVSISFIDIGSWNSFKVIRQLPITIFLKIHRLF